MAICVNWLASSPISSIMALFTFLLPMIGCFLSGEMNMAEAFSLTKPSPFFAGRKYSGLRFMVYFF